MLPEEFYEFAKILSDNYENLYRDHSLNSECIFRVVIDRLYYSTFLIAREYLNRNGCYQEICDNEHRNVSLSLKNCKLVGGTTLAGFLNSLRKERNKASYTISGIDSHFNEIYVKIWVVKSENFISNFRYSTSYIRFFSLDIILFTCTNLLLMVFLVI